MPLAIIREPFRYPLTMFSGCEGFICGVMYENVNVLKALVLLLVYEKCRRVHVFAVS